MYQLVMTRSSESGLLIEHVEELSIIDRGQFHLNTNVAPDRHDSLRFAS